MKRISALIFMILLSVFTSSCMVATLTKSGKSVKYVTKTEAPSGCKEIEEVELGFPKGSSVGDVKIKLRNKTAEMGDKVKSSCITPE